jgi:hypothetical protein
MITQEVVREMSSALLQQTKWIKRLSERHSTYMRRGINEDRRLNGKLIFSNNNTIFMFNI